MAAGAATELKNKEGPGLPGAPGEHEMEMCWPAFWHY